MATLLIVNKAIFKGHQATIKTKAVLAEVVVMAAAVVMVAKTMKTTYLHDLGKRKTLITTSKATINQEAGQIKEIVIGVEVITKIGGRHPITTALEKTAVIPQPVKAALRPIGMIKI